MSRTKPKSDDGDRKGNRTGRPIHAYVDPDVADALVDYINAQDVPPNMTRTVEKALIDFLTAKGFYPRRRGKS